MQAFVRTVWPVAVLALLASMAVSAQEDADCLMCHENVAAFDGFENAAALVVDEAVYGASVHGEAGLACVDCHLDLAGVGDWPHDAPLEPVECGMCHDDVAEIYAESLHGYARDRGNERAPDCAGCHGIHDILSSARSDARTHGVRSLEICAGCHGMSMRTDDFVKLPHTVGEYNLSVHGQRAGAGAARCVDCHGVHDLRGAGDPRSAIHPARVAETCGACHSDVRDVYDTSIHGRALQAGVVDSPTCTDCHSEHRILAIADPDAPTSAAHLGDTCGGCHGDPQLVAKYDLEGGVVSSYVDSYHGWATRRRSESAASCISCHTAHAVQPKDHPDSTIHPARVTETCRSCHPNADAGFAASYDHQATSMAANPVSRWIRNAYRVLIVAVIGGMAVHNLVILAYFSRRRRRTRPEGGWMTRMDRLEVLQHLVLALSFGILVLTGFALRFPEAWWVRYLTALGMTETARANTHRAFAIVMVAASVFHVVWIFVTQRGRVAIRAMLPARSDYREARDNLLFHVGRSRRPAEFGRFDYTQKAEYWALVWGTAIMAFTGVLLWWPALAVRLFPSWIIAAAQTIHYYEAWLATLAIVVWHFFFVILHPDCYPMNWTWVHGRMTCHEARHHHPRWYHDEIAAAARDTKETKQKPRTTPAQARP